MKIFLINPPLSLEERYGKQLKHFGALSEPLGLGYLASKLEKHGYQVKILDCPALDIKTEKISQELQKDNYRLVGITMLTPMYSVVKRTAEIIKKTDQQVKIVVGGTHATALPKETLADIRDIDYVCIGEGENTIVELAQTLGRNGDINQIAGLAHRKNNEIVLNKPRELEKDLDNFPPPARHLLPMEKYKMTASRTKGMDYCPTLIVARGCPFGCSYCSHPFGQSFRHHSIERILSEIKQLVNKYKIKQMNLEADTLTANKKFLMDLCNGLINSGFNKQVAWTCESRVDTVDEEMLQIMKKAGCWQISYGVETGVQRLLDSINKKVKLEQFEKIFALTKRIGISIRAFFMLGLPTETREESLKTIEFAKKLDPPWAQFTIAIPYPGTPMFKMLKENHEIRSFNWANYNTWSGWAGNELPYLPKGRDEKELRSLQKEALISFYLRPETFIKFLKQINSFKIFKRYFLGFLVLVTNKLNLTRK